MLIFSTTRQLAATPAAVFAAIRDAERLAKWWGPDDFSNHFEIFEFEAGGKWRFNMIGPDGKTYSNESVFSSIDEDRRVVIQHVSPPQFQLAITLEPLSGGTLVQWEQTFADESVGEALRHIVEPANEQNLDRLSVELGLADVHAENK